MRNLIIVFFLSSHLAMAQYSEYYCGTFDLPAQSNTFSGSSPCIDVQEILNELENGDNCRLIHINVNVHFLKPADGNGNCIGEELWFPLGKRPDDAYKIAEDFINAGNTLLAENPPTMNGTGVKLCNPFRMVLKGVYFHCDNRNDLWKISNLYSDLGVNKSSELNLFIIDGTFTGGIAILGGNYMGANFLTGGNLNHEFAHLFDIGHSFEEPFLADVPDPRINIDYNCDGIFSNPGDRSRAKEVRVQCGQLVPEPTQSGVLSVHNDQIGRNPRPDHPYLLKNDIYDCEEVDCFVHPCCNPLNVHNNVSGYNNAQNSFSFLQLEKMLNHLNAKKCDFINDIKTDRNCPPTSAFIAAEIPGQTNNNRCNYCLDLRASYNEEKYILELFEITNSGDVLKYSSGWINEQAGKICFSVFHGFLGTSLSSKKLKPNTLYKAKLKVGRNNCIDEDLYERQFSSPNCVPTSNPNFTTVNIYPNPLSGGIINVEFYNEIENEEFSLVAINLISGQYTWLMEDYLPTTLGNQNININVEMLNLGSYALVLISNSGIAYNLFTKI